MAHFIFISGSEEPEASWEATKRHLLARSHSWVGVNLADLPWEKGFEAAFRSLVASIPAPISEAIRPILIGHSAGGLLLPRLGDALGAVGEIYIAALVAAPGRSFLEQLFEDPVDAFTPEWLHEVRTSPKPSAEFLQPLYHAPFTAFAPRHRAYFLCSRDACIAPAWQSYASTSLLPRARRLSLDASHDPQQEAPLALALQIEAQANRWKTSLKD